MPVQSERRAGEVTESASRILIVDDDTNITKTLAAIMEGEGYEVSVASDLKNGTQLADRDRFEAAIVDLKLDNDDGLDLVRHLHERQSGQCSVIVLTGYGSLETAQEALRAEAYDYLTKPSDMDELMGTVRRAVERSSLIRQLEGKVSELEEAQDEIKRLSAMREQELLEAVDERTAELKVAYSELRDAYTSLKEEVQARERVETLVLDLSAPALPIKERLVLFPIIGAIDDKRAAHLNDEVLEAVRSYRTRVVVLDCTGLVEMTRKFAEHLVNMMQASQLLGASTVLTGLSSDSCDALAQIQEDLDGFYTASDLRSGIELAEEILSSSN